ncbi:dynamin family protein [Phytohabitans suffuscus]|uniref:Dynamin N-terminal domain-containing protein n=1 Tax=Phytohabitans suffuscus TaxID=624315 RepID=A0A6F8YVW2_9ACTN|nr:dynamin family protein [Phytohabitans suffuscus]BCB90078.1 hypothetical protein Psuf_073910 [Phytohabitans suffuscus]
MRSFEELRDEILALLATTAGAARAQGAEETVRRLDRARTRLADGRLTVLLCGEFKRGKSSVANALLGEVDLLPVDTSPETNLVATVTYGAVERFAVTLDDGAGGVTARQIERHEIARYVGERANPDNAKRVALLSIEVPNPRLRGLRLLDTPGIGGVHTAHTAVTMGQLGTADAVVFVTDTDGPLLESEREFIRTAARAARITDGTDGVVFVLNKIDLVDDYGELLADLRAKAGETLGTPGTEVLVVPVSAAMRTEHLRTGSEKALAQSNFPALEQALWTALGRRRVRSLAGGALSDLDSAAEALLVPLDAEAQTLDAETDQQVDALARREEDHTRRLAELKEGRTAWRAALQDDLKKLTRALRQVAEERVNEVWQALDTRYLDDAGYLANPRRLVGKLAADCAAVMGAVSQRAERETSVVLRDFAQRHALSLGSPQIQQLPPPPVFDVPVAGATAEGPDRRMKQTRDTIFGATIGGTAGSASGTMLGVIVGSVALPGVGTVLGWQMGALIGGGIGTLIGAFVTYSASAADAAQQNQRAERQRLQAALAPHRRTQVANARDAVVDFMQDLTEAVLNDLDSRIVQETESLRDALDRSRQAQRATRETAAERRAQLAGERQAIHAVRTAVAVLAREVADPEAPAPPEPFVPTAPASPGDAAAGGGWDEEWADE